MKIFFFRETELKDLNPETAVSRGMGATETSMVCLARELSKDHKVVVCCPTAKHKKYDGVEYIPFQNYVQVQINVSLFDPDIFIVVANPTFLFSFGSHDLKTIFWQQNHPEEMLRFPIQNLFTRPHTTVVFPSPEAADFARNFYKQSSEIGGIYNGVRDTFFRDSEKVKRKIIYSGSLSPAKGVYNLLQICHELADYKIHICGGFDMYGWESSEYRNSCMSLINRNSNVILEGSLGPDRLAEHLASAELCISNPAPKNKETCCVSALEAMAAGTPVVAGGGSIIDHIVSHGGVSCISDLSGTIKSLMGNKEKRMNLSNSGKKWVGNLRWGSLKSQWENLLWHVVEKGKKQPVGKIY